MRVTDASRPAYPITYRYVGARARPGTGDSAEGTLRVRPDLRGPNGPFASPLAIFFQDLSGIALVRYAPLVVPVQVNVRVRRSAADADELIGRCEMTRKGRSILASEAWMYDVRDPERVVAFATATWFNTGDLLEVPETRLTGLTPEGDDSEPIELADSILNSIGATPRADGRGLDLDEVAGPVTDDVVDCRIEVREEGGAGRMAAASIARFRVIG